MNGSSSLGRYPEGKTTSAFSLRDLADDFFADMAFGAALVALPGLVGEAALLAVLTVFLVEDELARAEFDFDLTFTAAFFFCAAFLDVGAFNAVFLAAAFLAGAAVGDAVVLDDVFLVVFLEAGLAAALAETFLVLDAAVLGADFDTDRVAGAALFAVAAFDGATLFRGVDLGDFDGDFPAAAFAAGFSGRFKVLVMLTTTSGGKRLQHVVSSKRRGAPAFTRRRSQVKGFQAGS